MIHERVFGVASFVRYLLPDYMYYGAYDGRSIAHLRVASNPRKDEHIYACIGILSA